MYYKAYQEIKERHPDAIVFLRLGDFYEAFDDDAQVASDGADLVMVTRKLAGKLVKMCGFPHHASHIYVLRLIQKGHRVAMCDPIVPDKGERNESHRN